MEWFDTIVESFGWVHFWIILGVVLAGVEALTVSFFALPFALGALLTAVFAYFDLPANAQIFLFAASSLVMLFAIQVGVKRYLTNPDAASFKTNTDALVGRRVLVVEPIEGLFGNGAVKVGGEIWTAVSREDRHFESGTQLWITEVDGAKLVVSDVEPVDTETEANV